MEELPAGDVELGEEIGSGGFSRVHKGRSKKLGMEVAVKVLDRQSCEAFSSLMKETDMMSKANSTYVLRVLAQYKDEYKGHIEYGLVMEYMPRGSLHSLFNTLKEKRVVIPWPLRFRILHQVAIAMNFLHGLNPAIIHRDLKPHNILLRKDFDVQLTDFGLARNETSVSIGLVGTLSYMPPESKIQTPTKKFDVYSFAILIWWILSGQDPQYPLALNTDMIMNCKQRGTRPNVRHLDYCMTEKMVPEVIELMKQCWDGDPDSRPCFTECMERLEKMKKAYDGEIENAVLEVMKELQKASPSMNNQAADTPDGANNVQSSDSELDPPLRILFGKQFKQKISEEEDNKTAASNTPGEDIFIADAEKFLRKNFSKIIKEKPAWKSILDDLFTQEIFKEEQVDFIVKGDRTVQDQIRETLRFIMNQGPDSCMTLVQIMNRHHPSLMSKMEI